ncbi:DUF484 family protein [Solimicrobium silvestre]|uniref:GAF domain n=1 Tax=Solimicrobium silvestre TaxID=2099400 RepID=A0A2S9H385_9BURK|nr:DUF484 family protein [Solimicrobium silvestre]PRC94444.1 hypothetical protein S2091_1065 [Solimicrobium silvestre]
MNHIEVASFLATNPHFFEEHAELLGTIKLSSPLLGRAVSLQERQMEVVRDKYRHLELRLSELLRMAQENDNATAKFQKWTNSLLLARNDVDLPHLLTTNLQEFFSLPHASLRLWNVAEEYQHAWFASPASDDIRLFARGLNAPFCGENKDFEAASWIDAPVASLAMLPLRANGEVIGLLVLGSSDKYRFTSTMATDLLSQIADTSSAALSCLIK